MVYTNFFNEEFSLICDFCYLTCTKKLIRSSLGEDICYNCFLTRSEIENIKYIILDDSELNLKEIIFLECIIETGDWKEIEKKLQKYSLRELKIKYYALFALKYEEKKELINEKSEPFCHNIASYAPKRNEFDIPDYLKDLFNINIPHFIIKTNVDRDILNLIFLSLKNIFMQETIKNTLILNKNLIKTDEIKNNIKNLSKRDYNVFNKIKSIIPFVSKEQFNIFFNELRKQNFLETKLNEKLLVKKEKKKISKRISKIESQLCKKLGIKKSIYFKIKCNALILRNENSISKYLDMFSGNESVLKIIFEFFKLNEWV